MSNSTTARFPILEYKDATGPVKEIYDEIFAYHSFVPNWYKTQGINLNILRGNWEKVKNTLFIGKVPLALKHLILWSIAKVRKCHYCETMHFLSTNSIKDQISSDPNFELTTDLNNPYIPQSFRTAVGVITEVALDPTQTSKDHYDALRDEGFTEVEIRELFALVGLAVFLTTYADISGVMLDEEAKSQN